MWEKIKFPAQANYKCQQTIHVTPLDTNSRRIMKAQRARKGVPENVCGRRGTFLHGAVPLCANHAGQRALKQVLEIKP